MPAKGVTFGRPSKLHLRAVQVGALLKSGLSRRRVASQTGLPLGSVFRISRCLLEPALPQ
jgi:hypothetical protein